MISITLTDQNIGSQKTECFGLLLEQDAHIPAEIAEKVPHLHSIVKKRHYSGKKLQVFVTPIVLHEQVVHVVIVGLGKKNEKNIIDIETYRRAIAKLLRTAEAHRCGSAALHLPDADLFGVSQEVLIKESAIALKMASYHFDEFITDKDRKLKHMREITLSTSISPATQRGLDQGLIIVDAVNMARHWIDAPPLAMTPLQLADRAQEIARKCGLKITQYNEHEITHMGMGGLAGVSKGSDQDCQLVILEYKAPVADAPTLCFVGKGITFDSGGLSLKPAQNMETMKDDMSGAAAVIATMKVLGQLKPKVNVIGITPLSENLPSGKATKPGDILTFYNGKTAEVKNTDAEGRLILADALSFAIKNFKIDAMIDIATLTGACSHALGPFFTGLMSQHEELSKKVCEAADRCGDRVWPLPFNDDFKPAIISPVADICNIGSGKYRAGAITAGFFLQHFVGDVPWVHLDIAGTAFDVPDIPYYNPDGATGVGVRLLVDLAMNWK